MKGKITEIFESIQGEGIYQGIRQIFLRFAECNLQCSFCTSEDANIILSKGKKRKIKDLRKYDELIAFDEMNKMLKNTVIDKIFQGETKEIYELELEDGNKLKITAEHLIFTHQGWIKVKDLKDTDKVLTVEE